MARFLILITFVLAAIFAGVVCSGCDSLPLAVMPVCEPAMYVAPCDGNTQARCWAYGSGPRVTGCTVAVCQSNGNHSADCPDSEQVPCVERCTVDESATDLLSE